jgi:hypothetical protein
MKQIGPEMRLNTTIQIFDYWNRLRGNEIAPLRSQVEPGDVRHILSSLFMLEAAENGRILFRLAGTRICDLFGRDLGGSCLSDLWAHGQEDLEKTAIGVMEHGIPAMLNATGYSTAGHHAAFEIILLPLRSNDGEGECDKLLGAIAPATAASWLEVIPLQFLALDRSRLLHQQLGAFETPTLDAATDAKPVEAGSVSIAETLRRMVANLIDEPTEQDEPFRHYR